MKKRIVYTDEPIEARVVADFLPIPDRLRFRRTAVKVTYDTDADTLHFRFRDEKVVQSDEVADGLVVDFDESGAIVGIGLNDASKRSENPKALEFSVS